MGVFVAHKIYWNSPNLASGDLEKRNEFLDYIRKAVEIAQRVGAKWMTVVPGHKDLRLQMGYQTVHVVEALKQASEILEPHGLIMVLEPLNFRDHPGLFLTDSPQAYEICKAVDSPSCKILFDIYHQQIQEGNLIPNIESCWDWAKLRKNVKKHGVRNSLLVAPMPTASTSQILGNNECFEPYTSNIYTRRVLSGEFIVVNKHLLEDLVNLGLWNENLKQELMRANGSIQHIDNIPEDIKELYKTVWELSMKDIIDMSRQRGYFIDQSQSLNLFMENANYSKLTSMHFYAWKSGLKTGMYYLRTKAAVDAIKFTLDNTKKKEVPVSVAADAEVLAATPPDPKAAKAIPVQASTVEGVEADVEPMTPEEMKALIAQAKAGEADDDCLMCGS